MHSKYPAVSDRVRKGAARKRHGMTRTPTYRSWMAMRRRCRDTRVDQYPSYGGSGVTVCDRWFDSFEAFHADLGARPPGTTLDRWPDNRGHYEPGNVRWATAKEQARNRTDNLHLTIDGHTRCVAAWAEYTQVPETLIRKRFSIYKWGARDAVFTPVTSRGGMRDSHIARHDYRGRYLTVKDLAALSGFSDTCIRKRLRLGLSAEDAVNLPVFALRKAKVVVNGTPLTYEEVAERYGLTTVAVTLRVNRGWTVEEVVSTPKGRRRKGFKRDRKIQ